MQQSDISIIKKKFFMYYLYIHSTKKEGDIENILLI